MSGRRSAARFTVVAVLWMGTGAAACGGGPRAGGGAADGRENEPLPSLACAVAVGDTSRWPRVSVANAVSLRLPSGYQEVRFRALDLSANEIEGSGRSERLALGRWSRRYGDGSFGVERVRRRTAEVREVPVAELPIVEQTECTNTVSGLPLRIRAYRMPKAWSTDDGSGGVAYRSLYGVRASLELASGELVELTGATRGRDGQQELLTMVRTIRVGPGR